MPINTDHNHLFHQTSNTWGEQNKCNFQREKEAKGPHTEGLPFSSIAFEDIGNSNAKDTGNCNVKKGIYTLYLRATTL